MYEIITFNVIFKVVDILLSEKNVDKVAKIIRKIKIKKKKDVKRISMQIDRIRVILILENIKNIPQKEDKGSAVVLPVNVTFYDDCYNDEKSATGAYFLKYFPRKIEELKKVIQQTLKDKGYYPHMGREYLPGTSIILPSPFDLPVKVILTATTLRREGRGIVATPSAILMSIEKIFEITADKKIEKIYLPLLGSGHGGMNKSHALLLILFGLNYVATRYHHIKEVTIFILPSDKDIINSLGFYQTLSEYVVPKISIEE